MLHNYFYSLVAPFWSCIHTAPFSPCGSVVGYYMFVLYMPSHHQCSKCDRHETPDYLFTDCEYIRDTWDCIKHPYTCDSCKELEEIIKVMDSLKTLIHTFMNNN